MVSAEKQREYDQRRYAKPATRNAVLKRSKRYYSENKSTIRIRHEHWFRTHREKAREYSRNYMRRLRNEIIKKLGGKCECCSGETYEFLQIDHRNGGGTAERRTMSTSKFLLEIRRQKFPQDKYRVLCANCNAARGAYGYCPHEKGGF